MDGRVPPVCRPQSDPGLRAVIWSLLRGPDPFDLSIQLSPEENRNRTDIDPEKQDQGCSQTPESVVGGETGADEPTGELDSSTASEIFEVLKTVNEASETTIVVVTHDPLVADHVNRTVAIRDGRTSSEVLRRTEVSDQGEHLTIAEEFVVLDRVGRLQLPNEYVEALDLERRVRLTLDPDHINVWPDREDGGDDD